MFFVILNSLVCIFQFFNFLQSAVVNGPAVTSASGVAGSITHTVTNISVGNVITVDGIAREDLLSDSQLDELDRLYAERKNLSNFYNFDGSRKTGEDLDIALELREFNELVNENVKYKTDYDKFNKARNAIIKKYGEDSPEFKKWISRNNV